MEDDMTRSSEMFQRAGGTTITQTTAREQLEDALLMTSSTASGGEAYREALESAPHLIALESDPDRYLRCENYDPIAAAQRLVAYWNKRKEIFGQDTFRSMVQIQEGALRCEDMDVLKTGFLTQLPNDGGNRVVIFHDRSRLGVRDLYPFEKSIRAAFYFLNVVSENEVAQREGVVMIFFFGDKGPPIPKINYTNEQSDPFLSALHNLMVSGAFPIRFRATHVVHMAKKPSVLQLAQHYNNTIRGTSPTNSIPGTFDSYDAPEHVPPRLEKLGLAPYGLPIVIGGSFDTVESFRQWTITRSVLEARRDDAKLLAEIKALRAAARGDSDLDEEGERNKRKREMDKVYAQRKRERRKIEMEVMQEQVDWLTDQNEQLKRTNTMLQDLLRQAEITVETYFSSKPTPREKRAFKDNYQDDDDDNKRSKRKR